MRPINVKLVCELSRQYATEYKETGLVGFLDANVQIAETAMTEVAPLEQWELNNLRQSTTPFPYEHRVIVDGVKFYTITTEPILLPATGELLPVEA